MNLPQQIGSEIIKIAGQDIEIVILDNGQRLVGQESVEKFNHILELGFQLSDEDLEKINKLR